MEPLEQTAPREQPNDPAHDDASTGGAPMFPDGVPTPLGLTGLIAPKQQRAHSALDVVALVLAVLIAPLGFVTGIVAAILSFRSRGYVDGLAKAAIVVSLILSLIGAAGGVVAGVSLQRQAREDGLRSSSAAMCTIIEQKPGVLTDAAFGWPAVDSTIPAYVAAVADYETWWTSVAASAPKQMTAQAQKVVTAAHAASERMVTSRVVDHDRDYADAKSVASVSTLPAWVTTYCR